MTCESTNGSIEWFHTKCLILEKYLKKNSISQTAESYPSSLKESQITHTVVTCDYIDHQIIARAMYSLYSNNNAIIMESHEKWMNLQL